MTPGAALEGPAPRVRRRDVADQALLEWSAWALTNLDLAGYGGVDCEGARVQRSGHSDPVLAEIIATETEGQDLPQRVHRHLLRYSREVSRDWFRVTWARYVGVQQQTAMVGQEFWGTVEIARHYLVAITIKADVPRGSRWSGMLAWEDVAKETGIKLRSAKLMLSLVKRELKMDLRLDERDSRLSREKSPSISALKS